jgi:hypothetical protein
MDPSLEDLLNAEDSDEEDVLSPSLPVNQHSSTVGATTSELPKSINLEHLLAMEDEDDEDDPAVLSSTIYEQFSHLMKTNENIKKEMAFPSMSLPFEKSKSKKISDLEVDLDDFADVDGSLLTEITNSGGGVLKSVESLTSADILSKLINDVDNEEDNGVGGGDVLPIVSTDVLPVASAYGKDKRGAELNCSAALEASQALRNAELREQKLLHYNSEKIRTVSALQIRRPVASGSSIPEGEANGCSVGSSGSVLTGLEEMKLITNQLQKNSSYSLPGPGASTALTVCLEFIAIGTIKGFILIFTHHQGLARVLTHPSQQKGGSGSGVAANGGASVTAHLTSVTELDALNDGSMIAAAYRFGDIIFWDSKQGVILKQIKDPANHDIVYLKFFRSVGWHNSGGTTSTLSLADSDSFHVLSVTTNSVINRYRISKALLSTWHLESDCLLDESSGVVVASSVLPPYSSYNPSNPEEGKEEWLSGQGIARYYSDMRRIKGNVQLFSFSFSSQTCIVSCSPEIKIVFKWQNSSPYESKDSKESLDWNWMKVPASAIPALANDSNSSEAGDSVICAVITRAREIYIELCIVLLKRTTSVPISSSAPVTSASTSSIGRSTRNSILMFTSALTGGYVGGSTTSSTSSASSDSYDSSSLPLLLSFECIPWINRRVHALNEPILSIKWIKTTSLIAFTKSEILLFDPSLNILEKCLLFPSLSNGFIASHGYHPFSAVVQRSSVAFSTSLSVTSATTSTTSEIAPRISVWAYEGILLTSSAMFKVFTRSPFDQANSLINSGRWLEGLSLIVENIGKSPSLLLSEGENIRRYILNYTLLAVKRGGSGDRGEERRNGSSTHHNKNHYYLVSSVCTEYCVATKQFTLLFDEIMEIFRMENQQNILLESFEPFILNGMMSFLPTSIILDFLSMGVSYSKLSSLEKCLISLDPRPFFSGTSVTESSLALLTKSNGKSVSVFDLLNFLHQNKLFSSFLYYYSFGGNQYCSSFQLTFQFLLELDYRKKQSVREESSVRRRALMQKKNTRDSDDEEEREGQEEGDRSKTAEEMKEVAEYDEEGDLKISILSQFQKGFDSNSGISGDHEEIYYKLLLYLQHIFEGKVFPRGTSNLSFYSGKDDISFPFSTSSVLSSSSPSHRSTSGPISPQTSIASVFPSLDENLIFDQEVDRSKDPLLSSSIARIVNGCNINAIHSLLTILTAEELHREVAIGPSTGSQSSSQYYEQSSLRKIEYPYLFFFSKHDISSFFYVLWKGIERLIFLFVSSSQNSGSVASISSSHGHSVADPQCNNLGSHLHLMIKETDATEGDTVKAEKDNYGAKTELIFVCKETVSAQQKQKNEDRIMDFLYKIYLFCKEQRERNTANTSNSSSSVPDLSSFDVLSYYFQVFSSLFLRLSNASSLSSHLDLLESLILYYANEIKRNPSFSIKLCEENLQFILENQLKLLLAGTGGIGSSNRKFSAFCNRIHAILHDNGFFLTAFLIKRYHPALFLSLFASTSQGGTRKGEANTGNSTDDPFTLQLKSYLGVYSCRCQLLSHSTLSVSSSPLSASFKNSTPPSFGEEKSGGINKFVDGVTNIDKETKELCFDFAVEVLEFFLKEKTHALTSLSVTSTPNPASPRPLPDPSAVPLSNSSAIPLSTIDIFLGRFSKSLLEMLVDLLELSLDSTVSMIVIPYLILSSSLLVSSSASTATVGLAVTSVIEATKKKNPELQFRFLSLLVQHLSTFHSICSASSEENGRFVFPGVSTGKSSVISRISSSLSGAFSLRYYFSKDDDLLHLIELFCRYSSESLLYFIKHYIFNADSSSSHVIDFYDNFGRENSVASQVGTIANSEELSVYPLDKIAIVLRRFSSQVPDVIAFFEEKFGKHEEALIILLKDFGVKLASMRMEIDYTIRQENRALVSGNKASITVSETGSKKNFSLTQMLKVSTSDSVRFLSSTASSLSAVALVEELSCYLKSCRLLKYSVVCILELCERHTPDLLIGSSHSEENISSTQKESEMKQAEKLWFEAFNSLLKERCESFSLICFIFASLCLSLRVAFLSFIF